ncbi:Chloramphenicol acetyltransferase-like domain protein [Beauveria brongniartii RCEF 3172]|uniref:Chloramphenicol acetyltransferase-like domain protein n=1 Tax=Beauveria brongniartii RCEF 3172 TaxID=1081107 RepID=A0A167H1P3_9HYPO|nr:Chloramphenicol acetyltransferase-like domain protein [Beauveria brongniartii RCEF 3172]
MDSLAMESKELVRPRIPLVAGVSPLPPLDQYMVRIVLSAMLVFEFKEPSRKQETVRNLKQGLAGAIEEMPLIAADIVTASEERQSIQLQYGDKAGVWFHVKELPEVDFDHLQTHNYPLSAFPLHDFVPEPRGHSAAAPVVTIQAAFIKGGLVLTVNGHHSAMDAQGLGTFVTVWSKHVDAASEGRPVLAKHRLSAECLDTWSIYGPPMYRRLDDFPPYSVQRDVSPSQASILQASMDGDFGQLAKFFRLTNWSISEEQLQTIRQDAAPSSKRQSCVTDIAAISAFIWMRVTKARGLSSRRNIAVSRLFTAVNCRRLMDPPLTAEYPGNCILLGAATMSSDELEACPSMRLHAVAQSISDSVDACTPEEIWSLTGSLQVHSKLLNAIVPPIGEEEDVIVTSPARLANVIEEAKWGKSLGKVKALKLNFPAWTDGFTVILPSPSGGYHVLLWISHPTANQLRKDTTWLAAITSLD